MDKEFSLFGLLMTILHKKKQVSPAFMDFLFQYSSRWFTIISFSAIAFLLLLFIQIILDFTVDYNETLDILSLRIVSYLFVFIPCIVILCYWLFLRPSSMNFIRFRKINTFISIIATSLMVLYLLLKLYAQSLLGLNKDFSIHKELNLNNVEVFLNSCLACTFYMIFWVLTHLSYVKLLLLITHNMIVLLFLIFSFELPFYYALKVFFILVMISIAMVIYCSYREKQAHDSFAYNMQKEAIQEEWKNMVNDFPNGVVLLSLDKTIFYLNHSLQSLFQLPNSLITMEPKQRTTIKEGLLDPLYINLVNKIGKIEEVFPCINGLESAHLELNKSEDFSIKEASDFTIQIPSNSQKSPKNVDSFRSLPLIKNQSKRKGIQSMKNSSIKGFIKENKTRKVDLSQKEQTLDDVIDKLNKKIKKEEIMLGSSRSRDLEGDLKTYCTQYKLSEENKTSSKRKYELKIKPIIYRNEPVFLIIIQDVSYLDLVQELRENNEYKTKVLTTLSHELRTPLNGAIAPLERIISDKSLQTNPSWLKNQTFLKELNVSYKSLMLLNSVLNDVVDFALINSNQLYLNYEEQSFDCFLKETLDIFSLQAQEKKIKLDLSYDKNNIRLPKRFKTDFQRLRQVLVSLLNNAIKNTFKGMIRVKISLIKIKTLNNTQIKVNKFKDFNEDLERKDIIENHEKKQLISHETHEVSDTLNLEIKPIFENQVFGPMKKKNIFHKNRAHPSKERSILASHHPKFLFKLTVEDTGVGIEGSKLKNIIKSLSSTDLLEVCLNLNRKKGCGLGLTISHCLALLLGSRNSPGLIIRSDPDKGTEVSFELEGFLEKDYQLESFDENTMKLHKRPSIVISKTQENIQRKRISPKCETSLQIPANENKRKKFQSLIESKNKNSIEEVNFIGNFLESHQLETHSDVFFTNNAYSGDSLIIGSSILNEPIKSEYSLRLPCLCDTVLIVDDDSFNLLALENILMRFGLKTEKAFNGEEAIELVLKREKCGEKCVLFPLAFLDYHMPIKNGMETTLELRSLFIKGLVPKFLLIGCTAFMPRDNVDKWKEAGIEDFLVKPIKLKNMEYILSKWGRLEGR